MFRLEQLYIVEGRFELTLFAFVEYFHHLVVARGRDAHLPAVIAYDTVDGVNLAEFAFLQVLEHTCLKKRVLLDGNRDDCERYGLFDWAVVVQELDYIFALDRLDSDASLGTYVDALIDEGLHDFA